MKTKTLTVRHTLITVGSQNCERVEIIREGVAEPIHVLDRKFPAQFGNEIRAAIESLTFGELAAKKLAKKGEEITYESNVPGAVPLYIAAQLEVGA